MKGLFLLVITVVVANAAPSTENSDLEWNNFKLTHQKQYRSLLEEKLRKEIFTQNLNKIIEHNALYDQDLVSYTLKINKYSDMTPEEMKKTLNGYKKSSIKLGDIQEIFFEPDENVDYPDSFDWREKGAVTPIKDQGQCGSCWTFSTTGALEGQYFLKTGVLPSISEQNLVDCSSEGGNDGCYGGDMVPAFTYVYNNDGIDSENSYPYEAANEKCRYVQSGNVTSLKGYGRINNGDESYLKAAIATIGPIAVAIDASLPEFDAYSSGIFYNEKCNMGLVDPANELDHAVLAVGYGSENGDDYWLIKNSWGTDWGEDGYIRVARNRDNNCGVAADSSYPILY